MHSNRFIAFAACLCALGTGAAFGQTISGFNPTVGQPLGQPTAQVNIDGAGFLTPSSVAQVWFNETPASFFINSNIRITAWVPPGATTGPISVQRAGGPRVFSIDNFTVIGPEPYITIFTPNSGGGGSVITIQGVQFLQPDGITPNVTAVKVNGTNVAGGFIQSNTRVFATNRADVTTGPITVSGPGGSHTTTDLFYVPPVITGFSPTNGPVGTNVVINGQNFLGATAVRFNSVDAQFFTVNNNTQIVATVPPMATSGKVSVVTPAAQYLTPSNFLVAPNITGFAPNAGPAGTPVTITGTTFNAGGLTVRFNGVVASITSSNATQIVAVVPPTATTGPISVSTTNGSAASTNLFYLPPIISNFTPANSPPGSTVTVNGVNFLGATAVTFNGAAALTFTVTNNTQLSAVVPNGVTTGPIRVTGPAGTGTSAALFYGAPVITGFIPTSGRVGTNVTIFGNNFQGTSAVRFNGTNASFSGVTSNQLTAVVPAGATTGPISVTAPAGTATSAENFVIQFSSDMRIVSFTDNPDPVTTTSNLTYVIVASNNGPDPATNATLSVTLPPAALKSASTTLGTIDTNGSPVVVSFGTLGAGLSATITLVVAPVGTGSIASTATANSPQPDPNMANNSQIETTTVLPVAVLAIQAVPPDKVRISWPAALNLTLQANANLVQTNGWANVGTVPVVIGNERVVTNDILGTNNFFRLRQ